MSVGSIWNSPPTEGKWRRLNYRFGGKEKRLSLGVSPDVGLKEARDRHDAARKLLADGVDPSENRKAEKSARANQAANSFETVASIQVRVETDRVCLIYRHRSRSGECLDKSYPVWLDRTSCNLGGQRPWFRCPARGDSLWRRYLCLSPLLQTSLS